MIIAILGILFESIDSLFKGIKTLLESKDFTVGAILAVVTPFVWTLNRIKKEKERIIRERRIEKRQLEIEQRQQRIESKIDDLMHHSGVESTWSLQTNGSGIIPIHILTMPCTLLQKVMNHQKRRMSMLTNLFKTSVSKKLTALLLGAAVAILNKKLHLDLTPDELLTFLIVIGSYIIGQSHIDARKVTAGIKDSPLLQMGFTEAIPILSGIHADINKILVDVKKNDGSQAFKDAMHAYAQIKPILDALKHPEPLAVIVEDKVAS